jgi:hypothetical protein
MRQDTRTGIRRHWRVQGATLIVVCVLCVTACTREVAMPSPSPVASASEAPLFASDEEALDAARTTYERFMEVSEAILSSGGAGAERIDDLVVPEIAEREKASYLASAADGRTLTGRSSISAAVLQHFEPHASANGRIVTIYVCVDFSDVDVLDRDGNSTVLASRPPRIPFEVSFKRDITLDIPLRIVANDVWAGAGVC